MVNYFVVSRWAEICQQNWLVKLTSSGLFSNVSITLFQFWLANYFGGKTEKNIVIRISLWHAVWFKTKMSGWRKSPLLLRRAFDNNLTSDKMWNEAVTEVKIQSVFCGIPGRWETVIVGGRAREVCLKADTNFYRHINGACLTKQVGPNKNRTGSLSVGIILIEK